MNAINAINAKNIQEFVVDKVINHISYKMEVWSVIVINLRCCWPDADVYIFKKKDDAINYGVEIAHIWNCNLDEKEMVEYLDSGDGINPDESEITILLQRNYIK